MPHKSLHSHAIIPKKVRKLVPDRLHCRTFKHEMALIGHLMTIKQQMHNVHARASHTQRPR